MKCFFFIGKLFIDLVLNKSALENNNLRFKNIELHYNTPWEKFRVYPQPSLNVYNQSSEIHPLKVWKIGLST